MSFTRCVALAAAVSCGLTMTLTGLADEKPPPDKKRRPDPVVMHLPKAARAVVEDTFPGHRCVRLGMRQEKGETVYRVTVFNPADTRVHSRQEGVETVSQPVLYHLELTADGKVIEETRRPVLDPGRLPRAVADRYRKWNPNGVKGMFVRWSTEVPRGGARVYHVGIVVNAIKAHRASFKEDGSVLAADPAVVP